MSTLFYWSELTDCIRSNDVETMLQRETCQLISKYCRQFNLDDDVEFACYEFAHKHFQNVEQSIAAGYKSVGVEPLLVEQNLDDYVQTAMLNIEMDLPLHLFAIISITAKYFGARSWSNTYRMLPNLLQTPDRIVSFREIYHMEFRIFRSLNFSITPSAPYERVQTILEYCSEHLQTEFRQLRDTCNALLRFTYIERHIIYKRAHALNWPDKDYIVNETFIASTIVFAAALYNGFDEILVEDLMEVIKVRTGLKDQILRNFAQAILREYQN